jgi:RNA-directed DNA polymerase
MRKRRAKDGVGQLVLQIAFPEEANNAAGETQANGPGASRAPVTPRSKTERKGKWYSLYDKVYAPSTLGSAWLRVKENAGAPGIDRMSVKRFDDAVDARLEHLAADLRSKSYRPQPVRRVFIPKSGGGRRPLGIPTVRDRIVQQALLQVLEPIFESGFSSRSHGFRPERGCATALGVVDRAVRSGYEWVVDADIGSFFDTVDQQKLLKAVNAKVSDGSVLNLIGQILKAGVVHPSVGEIEPTELGMPQGGPLSPLLANIYLHRLDEQLVAAKLGLVRYADDFVIFAKSESEAQQALILAREVLEGELGLAMHPEKTRVVSVASGFEFLGFHYFRDPTTGQRVKEVRQKSVRNFREAIRSRTPRLITQRRVKAKRVTLPRLRKNARIRQMLASVDRLLRGWHVYFRHVWSRYPETPFRNFDGFVRQRVRTAITGRVGSGWWNIRLSNKVLSALGLLSLDDLQRRWHRRRDLLTAPARQG